jgi:hypothetical protein
MYVKTQHGILQHDLELSADQTVKAPVAGERISFFDKCIGIVTFLIKQVEQLTELIQQLRDGKLPIGLYDQIELTLIATHIKRIFHLPTVDTTDGIISRMELQRLTKTMRVKDCTDNCRLDIFTILPLITADNEFVLKEIMTLPKAESAYIGSPKWKQIVPSKFRVLTNSKDIFKIDQFDDLQCLSNVQDNVDSCQICFTEELTNNKLNECEQALISSDRSIHAACSVEEIKDPQDQIVRIFENKWAFVDSTPGTLTEECPMMPQITYNLPYTGVITFNPNCSYNLVNGPFGTLPAVMTGIKLIATQGSKIIKNLRTLDTDLTKLQTHFQEYGYIYVISFSFVLALILVCLAYFCCLRFRQIRAVKNRSKKRSKRIRYTVKNNASDEETISIEPPTRPKRTPFLRILPAGISVNEIV